MVFWWQALPDQTWACHSCGWKHSLISFDLKTVFSSFLLQVLYIYFPSNKVAGPFIIIIIAGSSEDCC